VRLSIGARSCLVLSCQKTVTYPCTKDRISLLIRARYAKQLAQDIKLDAEDADDAVEELDSGEDD
jgi:hypothetical protein